jgi:hypothetical protein
MRNEYLVPVNIIDLINKFNDAKGNEKVHLMQRVQAIQDICAVSLKKYNDTLQENNVFVKRTTKKK